MEGLCELEGIDELGIEARGHLNTHAAQEQEDVHPPQVGLLVPWRLVLGDEAGDDGVGGGSYVDHLDGWNDPYNGANGSSLKGLVQSIDTLSC